MDFTNKNLGVLFSIGNDTVYLTQTFVSTWIVMAILIVFAVIVRLSMSKFKDIPNGFQNIVEAMVETMSNFAVSTMGKKLEGYGGIYFSFFIFILVSNYSGLFGLRVPTADLGTTGALAIMTFSLIHYSGIRMQRKRYFKGFFEPNPIFFPINLVGEFSKPISLGFRLFGNMLGGLIIMGLVYEMLPFAMRFILPDVLHAYFDIFAGALQAFIFTVLSMTFISQKAGDDEMG